MTPGYPVEWNLIVILLYYILYHIFSIGGLPTFNPSQGTPSNELGDDDDSHGDGQPSDPVQMDSDSAESCQSA